MLVTSKRGFSGHLLNTLLVEEGQVAISLRRRLRLTQKWPGAYFCYERDEFSAAMKVSSALTSLFPFLAGKAYGLLSKKISANYLDGAHSERLFSDPCR